MFDMPIFESITVIEETGNAFLAMMRELFAGAPVAAGVEEHGEQIGRIRKRGCVGGVGRT